MLLLERVRPGSQLTSLSDDDQATQVAADLMLALRRPVPPGDGLIPLGDWLKGLEGFRERYGNKLRPPDVDIVQRAADIAAVLMTEEHVPLLIHGDLHHFNILFSERGWLAIDPKGVVAPPEYELGPFLINPWLVTGLAADTAATIDRRIDVLAERLGLRRRRIREWGLVHAALSALWSLEEGRGWRNAIECARILIRDSH